MLITIDDTAILTMDNKPYSLVYLYSNILHSYALFTSSSLLTIDDTNKSYLHENKAFFKFTFD